MYNQSYMKKIILSLTVFLSSILFTSTSLGEWKYVESNVSGDRYFVDYDQIRQKSGKVYYWTLADYKEPLPGPYFSSKSYTIADCEIFRSKILSWVFYKGQMGQGNSETDNRLNDWRYPAPDTLEEVILKSVCERI